MNEVLAANAYRVERGDIARDREAVLAIWRGNLGQDERMRAKFDWFYRNCPYGTPLLALLRHDADDQFVGVAAIGPRRMWHGGHPIRAGVLVDLAVASAHRSLGPALMLQRELATAGAQHFDFLYGFPNAKAVPLIRRLGAYQPLADIVRYARVLRYRHYAGRHLPRALAPLAGSAIDFARHLADWPRRHARRRLRGEWGGFDDARVDALWQRSARGSGCITARDRTFLQWRFGQVADARLLRIESPDGAQLKAWFACQPHDRVLHVHDWWGERGSALDSDPVQALLVAADRAGYAAVSFEHAGPASCIDNWIAAGFVERSRRPVYGRWCAASPAPDFARELHLTSADEDE